MSLILAALLHPLNDITTRFEPALVFHQLVVPAYNLANKEKQESLYPDLVPLLIEQADADTVFKKALELAKSEKTWQVVASDLATRHLEAVATTGLLHFKDDLVIEVMPEGAGASVQMRSRSRVGRSDLAANYKRIRAYFATLRTQF